VVDLAHEKDPEILRQVAQMQERELERVKARLRAATAELSVLRNETPEQLQRKLLKLEEQLAQRERELFARSSESRRDSFIGQRETETKTESQKQRGHGPRNQPELPVIERSYELDAPDQVCTSCGGALGEMDGHFEESEEVDVVERRFVVVKHKRKKYRCACGGCVETALGPDKLRPGNRYSVDFAVEVATAKYLDHLPLERQVRIMKREGLRVDSQTLWDQLEALARPLRDVPERILAALLAEPVVGMDETTWGMLDGSSSAKWYVWSVTGTRGVVHRIFESRSSEAATELLGDYAGTVVTDGFAGYQTAKRRGRFRLAHCWAHVRRKFLEAEHAYPREAGAVLNLIDELFALEGGSGAGPPERELVLKVRDERTRWVLRALLAWGLDIQRTALPESSIGKAAAYMCKLWTGLTRFRDDPDVPPSNNASERGLRGVVLGRKNHYGSKSKRGTEVAALFYTLFESAKLCGIEPKAYVRRAVRAAVQGNLVPLPHEVAAELATLAIADPSPNVP